jgi:hypothetical protein
MSLLTNQWQLQQFKKYATYVGSQGINFHVYNISYIMAAGFSPGTLHWMK